MPCQPSSVGGSGLVTTTLVLKTRKRANTAAVGHARRWTSTTHVMTFVFAEIIDNFQLVDAVQDMPESEICPYCRIEHYSMLQRSRCSLYNDFVKSQLEYSLDQCRKVADNEKHGSPIDVPVRSDF